MLSTMSINKTIRIHDRYEPEIILTLGFLYFSLTYKSDSITADPKQIILRYKLNTTPAVGSNYKVYAIILYAEIRIDPIGNEILII